MLDDVKFSSLIGKTLVSVTGAKQGSERIVLVTSDGDTFHLFHSQDCCESVEVDDVIGEVSDLIGAPLVLADESESDKHPEGYTPDEYEDGSFTWTFYRLATAKGHVDIRWHGSSNGYYSESVNFEQVQP